MIIVNYHEISAEGGGPYDMAVALFEAQIDALVEHGFTFVTLDRLLSAPAEDAAFHCAVTFDDGRLGAWAEGARVLDERGIRATMFVCPEWLEQPPTASREAYSGFMTWDHAADLVSRGHIIGSHGRRHLPFFEIGPSGVMQELSESRSAIEHRLGVACDHAAAPWGQVDATGMRLARQCGYRTLSSTAIGANKAPVERYRLRRVDSSCYGSAARLAAAALGFAGSHGRLDVALVELSGRCRKNAPEVEALCSFDVIASLDAGAGELGRELGLPVVDVERGSAGDPARLRALVRDVFHEKARDRTIAVTPVTLRGASRAWTYLSSFLPGTSRTR